MIHNPDQEQWGREPGEPSRRWTSADVKTLRSMVHNAAVDTAIAEALGRTTRSVAIKRQRLGLTLRTLGRVGNVRSLSDHTLIRELRSRGYTVSSSRRTVGGE